MFLVLSHFYSYSLCVHMLITSLFLSLLFSRVIHQGRSSVIRIDSAGLPPSFVPAGICLMIRWVCISNPAGPSSFILFSRYLVRRADHEESQGRQPRSAVALVPALWEITPPLTSVS
jgi:hypothetical protein